HGHRGSGARRRRSRGSRAGRAERTRSVGQTALVSASQPTVAHEALVADLAAALAPDRVRTGAVELDLYGRAAWVVRGSAAVACLPLDTDGGAAAARVAGRHGRPFVAGGSGTGLAGGAAPVGDPVVSATTKMGRIREVDVDERGAWVQPGVVNLDL